MNDEFPKPITQLAGVIDRSGQRERNRLGERAIWMTAVSWLGWLCWLVIQARVAYLLPLAYFFLAVGVTIASVVLGIVALVRAKRFHLMRLHAVLAIVMALMPLVIIAGLLCLLLCILNEVT